MRKTILYVAVLSALAGAALAAEPPPQFSVQDLQRDFAAPPAVAPPDTSTAADATGPCEAQGMATAADGSCQVRVGRKRGFSLASPESASKPQAPAAASAGPRAPAAGAGAPRGRQTASRGPMPAPTARGRDLLISFGNNSTDLTDQSRSNAKVFADALNTPQLQTLRFEIDGHTNAVGSRESNQRLSLARAQALVDYLAQMGVDRSRLEVHGYGFDRPVNPANPRAAENRRVEARRLN